MRHCPAHAEPPAAAAVAVALAGEGNPISLMTGKHRSQSSGCAASCPTNVLRQAWRMAGAEAGPSSGVSNMPEPADAHTGTTLQPETYVATHACMHLSCACHPAPRPSWQPQAARPPARPGTGSPALWPPPRPPAHL